MSDLGRFQRGKSVSVVPGIAIIPDNYPLLVVAGPSGFPGYTANVPLQRGAGFGARIFLGSQFPLGTYTATVTWSLAGNPSTYSATFEVVGGGDSGGPVNSLNAYDRPEARYVLAQLGGGKLVQGRNPLI